MAIRAAAVPRRSFLRAPKRCEPSRHGRTRTAALTSRRCRIAAARRLWSKRLLSRRRCSGSSKPDPPRSRKDLSICRSQRTVWAGGPFRDQVCPAAPGSLCVPAIHGFQRVVNHTGTARADPLHGPGCLKAAYVTLSCSDFELSSSHCAVAESSRTGAVDAPAGSRHGASDSCMSACLPRGVASDRAGSSIASLHRRLAKAPCPVRSAGDPYQAFTLPWLSLQRESGERRSTAIAQMQPGVANSRKPWHPP